MIIIGSDGEMIPNELFSLVSTVYTCIHTYTYIRNVNIRMYYAVNLLSGDMVRMHLFGPLAAIFVVMNVSSTAIVGDLRTQRETSRHGRRTLNTETRIAERAYYY